MLLLFPVSSTDSYLRKKDSNNWRTTLDSFTKTSNWFWQVLLVLIDSAVQAHLVLIFLFSFCNCLLSLLNLQCSMAIWFQLLPLFCFKNKSAPSMRQNKNLKGNLPRLSCWWIHLVQGQGHGTLSVCKLSRTCNLTTKVWWRQHQRKVLRCFSLGCAEAALNHPTIEA